MSMHRLPPPLQPPLDVHAAPGVGFVRMLLVTAICALGAGLAFYLNFRSGPLALWLALGLNTAGRAPFAAPAWLESLPSFVHALAFTCLIAACWQGRWPALVGAALFSLGLNAAWEFMCLSDASITGGAINRMAGYTIGPHSCTFDTGDIAAAACGALLPLALRIAWPRMAAATARRPAIASTTGTRP